MLATNYLSSACGCEKRAFSYFDWNRDEKMKILGGKIFFRSVQGLRKADEFFRIFLELATL